MAAAPTSHYADGSRPSSVNYSVEVYYLSPTTTRDWYMKEVRVQSSSAEIVGGCGGMA